MNTQYQQQAIKDDCQSDSCHSSTAVTAQYWPNATELPTMPARWPSRTAIDEHAEMHFYTGLTYQVCYYHRSEVTVSS